MAGETKQVYEVPDRCKTAVFADTVNLMIGGSCATFTFYGRLQDPDDSTVVRMVASARVTVPADLAKSMAEGILAQLGEMQNG